MDDPLAGPGLEALQLVLRSFGVRTRRLEVRSARGSLWVAVPDIGVAARVSTHTGLQRRQPAEWLARELRVADRARELGLPVMRPAETIDPGPHESDGFQLSFWEDANPDGGGASADQLADLLVRLHHDLTPDGLDLPVIPALVDGVEDGLHTIAAAGIDPAVHDALQEVHRAALADVAPSLERSPHVVLHGDAHPGNTVHAPFRGWILIDLEETGRGPVEADLAVLMGDGDGLPAVHRYCAAVGRPNVLPEELEPWRVLRSVSASVWLIGCAITYPVRYRSAAIHSTIDLLDCVPARRRPGRGQIAEAVSALGVEDSLDRR